MKFPSPYNISDALARTYIPTTTHTHTHRHYGHIDTAAPLIVSLIAPIFLPSFYYLPYFVS